MQHTMKVLDRTGHTTYAWTGGETGGRATMTVDDVTTEVSMGKVRADFDDMIARGHFATTVETPDGGATTGTVTRTFDPQADTILSPQIIGG